jgi:hypothetical protein
MAIDRIMAGVEDAVREPALLPRVALAGGVGCGILSAHDFSDISPRTLWSSIGDYFILFAKKRNWTKVGKEGGGALSYNLVQNHRTSLQKTAQLE